MSQRVLFVCIHNSARSQIAEALLKKYGKDLFEVESAGFEPAPLNPLAIEVLEKEEGIDISKNTTDAVFDLFKQGKHFKYVIAVCDQGNAQKCPIFPGVNFKLHWSFEDPSLIRGTDEEKYEKVKNIYKLIKIEVLKFIKLVKENRIKEDFPSNWRVG